MNKNKLTTGIVSIVLLILFIWFIMYTSLPILSFKYASFGFFIGFILLFVALIYLLFFSSFDGVALNQNINGYVKVENGGYVRSPKKEVIKRSHFNIFKIMMSIVIILPVISIVGGIISTPMFRSSSYYNVIDETITTKNFNEDFNQLTNQTVSTLPNIDSSLAEKKATTLFGETKGFGSEYQLGMFTDQIVDGKFVTVAPIEYNGFFKYNTNKSNGTPGFIVVDKESYSTTDNGTNMYTNYNLKYLPSSYFGTDLLRHVYTSGYMTKEITVSGFELDDTLNPYWIINIYENTVAPYGLKRVTGVLTVDAQTGTINEYTLDNAPTWIDNIQDDDTIMQMVNNYGMYEQGFMNSMFAQSGVTQTTHGSRHLVINDVLYLFTGLTSVGADESISQILLINTRTLETSIYNVSGATEYVAMKSAEGKLQNYGYNATFPIPVNINNTATYFIPLKDTSGLIKHYTFVQISNHTVIGAGDTIEEAYSNYLSQLSSTDSDNLETIVGYISRINFVNGIGYIYINNQIYYSNSPQSSSMIVSKEGDNVTIKVIGNLIVDFKNNTLSE